ncbi:MAG: (2Fe-2S)-binding protein [Clostridiales bacterium]|nr:(2Fe-2S)-binding protein [Clostridiales bacterium]
MTKFEKSSLLLMLKVNGEEMQALLEGPHVTLADVLRNKLGLTGTKEACRCGECGSCTVLVDGTPMLSCSVLAVAVRGKEITTIEGLAKGGELHPIQQAFIDSGAIQCGFCSPGMILMAKALLEENPDPTELEIKEHIGGNLCRCTGYIKIIEAIQLAAKRMGKGAA